MVSTQSPGKKTREEKQTTNTRFNTIYLREEKKTHFAFFPPTVDRAHKRKSATSEATGYDVRDGRLPVARRGLDAAYFPDTPEAAMVPLRHVLQPGPGNLHLVSGGKFGHDTSGADCSLFRFFW